MLRESVSDERLREKVELVERVKTGPGTSKPISSMDPLDPGLEEVDLDPNVNEDGARIVPYTLCCSFGDGELEILLAEEVTRALGGPRGRKIGSGSGSGPGVIVRLCVFRKVDGGVAFVFLVLGGDSFSGDND